METAVSNGEVSLRVGMASPVPMANVGPAPAPTSVPVMEPVDVSMTGPSRPVARSTETPVWNGRWPRIARLESSAKKVVVDPRKGGTNACNPAKSARNMATAVRSMGMAITAAR